MAKFSLSWDAYKSNICSGLSALQQNGEFVDMTLAADGHHVKVHQMLMSLVSPYIKDIITSTHCQHPVIFLNKISYTTLCAILEYIYTGEVTIEKDNLPDLIQAGRDLCINGLKDMKYKLNSEGMSQAIRAGNNKGHALSKTSQETEDQTSDTETTLKNEAMDMEQVGEDHHDDENIADHSEGLKTENENSEDMSKNNSVLTSQTRLDAQIQYCVSYRGSLHMILNRYIYYLKYKSRKGKAGHRTWTCSDNFNPRIKCPATVTTQGGAVIKRKHAHTHPFHDKAIMRRMRESGVFAAIDDNQLQELVKNKGKQKPPAAAQNKKTEDDTE